MPSSSSCRRVWMVTAAFCLVAVIVWSGIGPSPTEPSSRATSSGDGPKPGAFVADGRPSTTSPTSLGGWAAARAADRVADHVRQPVLNMHTAKTAVADVAANATASPRDEGKPTTALLQSATAPPPTPSTAPPPTPSTAAPPTPSTAAPPTPSTAVATTRPQEATSNVKTVLAPTDWCTVGPCDVWQGACQEKKRALVLISLHNPERAGDRLEHTNLNFFFRHMYIDVDIETEKFSAVEFILLRPINRDKSTVPLVADDHAGWNKDNVRVFTIYDSASDLISYSTIAGRLWRKEKWCEKYGRIFMMNTGVRGPIGVQRTYWVDDVGGNSDFISPMAWIGRRVPDWQLVIGPSLSLEVAMHLQSIFYSMSLQAAFDAFNLYGSLNGWVDSVYGGEVEGCQMLVRKGYVLYGMETMHYSNDPRSNDQRVPASWANPFLFQFIDPARARFVKYGGSFFSWFPRTRETDYNAELFMCEAHLMFDQNPVLSPSRVQLRDWFIKLHNHETKEAATKNVIAMEEETARERELLLSVVTGALPDASAKKLNADFFKSVVAAPRMSSEFDRVGACVPRATERTIHDEMLLSQRSPLRFCKPAAEPNSRAPLTTMVAPAAVKSSNPPNIGTRALVIITTVRGPGPTLKHNLHAMVKLLYIHPSHAPNGTRKFSRVDFILVSNHAADYTFMNTDFPNLKVLRMPAPWTCSFRKAQMVLKKLGDQLDLYKRVFIIDTCVPGPLGRWPRFWVDEFADEEFIVRPPVIQNVVEDQRGVAPAAAVPAAGATTNSTPSIATWSVKPPPMLDPEWLIFTSLHMPTDMTPRYQSMDLATRRTLLEGVFLSLPIGAAKQLIGQFRPTGDSKVVFGEVICDDISNDGLRDYFPRFVDAGYHVYFLASRHLVLGQGDQRHLEDIGGKKRLKRMNWVYEAAMHRASRCQPQSFSLWAFPPHPENQWTIMTWHMREPRERLEAIDVYSTYGPGTNTTPGFNLTTFFRPLCDGENV